MEAGESSQCIREAWRLEATSRYEGLVHGTIACENWLVVVANYGTSSINQVGCQSDERMMQPGIAISRRLVGPQDGCDASKENMLMTIYVIGPADDARSWTTSVTRAVTWLEAPCIFFKKAVKYVHR